MTALAAGCTLTAVSCEVAEVKVEGELVVARVEEVPGLTIVLSRNCDSGCGAPLLSAMAAENGATPYSEESK